MKKFVCPVCGYVYEGEFIPEGFKCPVCGVDGSKFKVMEEGKLAAEHEYGIYAKTVKNSRRGGIRSLRAARRLRRRSRRRCRHIFSYSFLLSF